MTSKWDFSLTNDAESDFKKLDKVEKIRVFKKLEWLCSGFDIAKPLPLTGEWQGFFKLRIGDIRVIYKAEYGKNLLRVYVIDWRDKVYKK